MRIYIKLYKCSYVFRENLNSIFVKERVIINNNFQKGVRIMGNRKREVYCGRGGVWMGRGVERG